MERDEFGPRPDLTPEERIEMERANGLDIDLHTIELIQLGLDTQAWSVTKPGRYMIARAEAELNDSVRELLDMSHWDPIVAQALHAKARNAREVLRWLDEAITEGTQAAKLVEQRDRADRVIEQHET